MVWGDHDKDIRDRDYDNNEPRRCANFMGQLTPFLPLSFDLSLSFSQSHFSPFRNFVCRLYLSRTQFRCLPPCRTRIYQLPLTSLTTSFLRSSSTVARSQWNKNCATDLDLLKCLLRVGQQLYLMFCHYCTWRLKLSRSPCWLRPHSDLHNIHLTQRTWIANGILVPLSNCTDFSLAQMQSFDLLAQNAAYSLLVNLRVRTRIGIGFDSLRHVGRAINYSFSEHSFYRQLAPPVRQLSVLPLKIERNKFEAHNNIILLS